MNATTQLQAATTAKAELIHTQLGFDLLCDPGDYVSALALRNGIHEAAETDLVTRIIRDGDTCIDAGCRVGYYSCLLARLVAEKGKVYSFDANPRSCHSTRRNLDLNGLHSAEVIHAALGDRNGEVQFGVSPLGFIAACKETIVVPCQRLEVFLNDRSISSVRLLKLDVEGAGENVLKGLGPLLAAHVIDFILVRCFHENPRLLGSSTEGGGVILKSAGYTCWEFGTDNQVGWSRISKTDNPGDGNYLFASPGVSNTVPVLSLAPVLGWTRSQWQEEKKQWLSDAVGLRENVDKLHDDIDWLLNSIKGYEEKVVQLVSVHEERVKEWAAEKQDLKKRRQELEEVLKVIEGSVSWRMLNKWRRARNRLLPMGSIRGKIYHSLIGRSRGCK